MLLREYYTATFPLFIIMTDSHQVGTWRVASCHDYDDGDKENDDDDDDDDAKMTMAICDDDANSCTSA